MGKTNTQFYLYHKNIYQENSDASHHPYTQQNSAHTHIVRIEMRREREIAVSDSIHTMTPIHSYRQTIHRHTRTQAYAYKLACCLATAQRKRVPS